MSTHHAWSKDVFGGKRGELDAFFKEKKTQVIEAGVLRSCAVHDSKKRVS
jgi:hypothetical protein